MDAAVQTILGGVDTLLENVPHGCGEQTMIIMATFNNISLRSVLLVEETRVCRENHQPATSH
jgi:hypothetical protein